MRAARVMGLGAAMTAACLGSGGCHLIGGLDGLKIDEGGSTTSSGGGGTGGATGGTGGTGGMTGGTGGTGGATCNDGRTNGQETDRDCGGPDCPPCDVGQVCLGTADCASGICDDTSGAKLCAKAAHIAVGSAHTCAVLDNGAVYCWGANDSGQLGASGVAESPTPVKVALGQVTEIAAGGVPGNTAASHTCALTQGRQVYCWGANDRGQLGGGDPQGTPEPALVSSLSDVSGIAVGAAFSCAFLLDGSLSCWGNNQAGELGDGADGSFSPDPKVIVTGAAVKGLATGARHGCALLDGGGVACWGDDTRGQAASDPPVGAIKITPVASLSGVTGIAAGQDFACAVVGTSLSCWGDNTDAQLSDAVPDLDDPVATPASLALASVLDVALGADTELEGDDIGPRGGHACALLDVGKVTCWGNDRSGQLGRGVVSGTGQEAAPAEIAGLDGVVEIAAGGEVSCAILTSGAVRCWGRNDRGQLGTGAIGDSQSSPVPVAWP